MRSFSSPAFRRSAKGVLKVVGWGMLTLLISATLISLRILFSDDTDMFWDHPSMFPEIVRMAYDQSTRSDWGPTLDLLFFLLPMTVYVGAIAPNVWESSQEEEPSYGRSPWPYYDRPPAAPEPPELQWGYAEYRVEGEHDDPFASRTPTLIGFPPPPPPAERPKPSIDDLWDDDTPLDP